MSASLILFYYAGLIGIAATSLHRLYFALRSKKIHDFLAASPLEKPACVTLQIPVFNEKHVVSRILSSISRIEYPKSCLQIQILDDSDDETTGIIETHLRSLREEGWTVEHLRRGHRKDFKAGALKEALASASGDYVAIFDADFVVPPTFFNDTLPQFDRPQVGCVQIRWDFFNAEQNLLTKLQAILLRAHFEVEQRVRFDRGSFLTFNGTAGIWRKACIENSGGWQNKSLTEDLDLSYRAQLNGWTIIYLNELTALSQLPVSFLDFQRQQSRWAKGSMQSLKNLFLPLLRSKLSFAKKFSALLHLGRHFSYLFTLAVLIAMPWVVSARAKGDVLNYVDALAFFLSTASVMYYFSIPLMMDKNPIQKVTLFFGACLLGLSITVQMVASAFEGLFLSVGEFVRTPKYVRVGSDYRGRGNKKDALDLLFFTYFCFCFYRLFFSDIWLSKPFLVVTLSTLMVPVVAWIRGNLRAIQIPSGIP